MLRAERFVFEKATFNPAASGFEFSYRAECGVESLSFIERLTVPGPKVKELWERLPSATQKSLLDSLHLVLGVRYWSMFSSGQIVLESTTLSEEQACFWETVYTKGLGEFFYVNQIDWRGLVRFPFVQKALPAVERCPCLPRALLAFGGGKDSIVAAESLRESGAEFSLFSLGAAAVQVKAAEVAGKELIVLRQNVDPLALDLQRKKEVYSGHIPYTAIYTFAGLLAALLFDFSRLVFANEKSADEGNIEYLGMEINHQWSKTSEFERLVKKYIADFITKDVEVYSLLRPYSELEIIKQFVEFPQYHHSFSSCNSNFASGIKSSRSPYWCGHCAKCAFVFTALAAYLPKAEAASIVGKDMFADESLLPLFEQLAGLRDFKPFECVGTAEEMRTAFRLAVRSTGHDSVILNKLSQLS